MCFHVVVGVSREMTNSHCIFCNFFVFLLLRLILALQTKQIYQCCFAEQTFSQPHFLQTNWNNIPSRYELLCNIETRLLW